jgi:hypothetical protein
MGHIIIEKSTDFAKLGAVVKFFLGCVGILAVCCTMMPSIGIKKSPRAPI